MDGSHSGLLPTWQDPGWSQVGLEPVSPACPHSPCCLSTQSPFSPIPVLPYFPPPIPLLPTPIFRSLLSYSPPSLWPLAFCLPSLPSPEFLPVPLQPWPWPLPWRAWPSLILGSLFLRLSVLSVHPSVCLSLSVSVPPTTPARGPSSPPTGLCCPLLAAVPQWRGPGLVIRAQGPALPCLAPQRGCLGWPGKGTRGGLDLDTTPNTHRPSSVGTHRQTPAPSSTASGLPSGTSTGPRSVEGKGGDLVLLRHWPYPASQRSCLRFWHPATLASWAAPAPPPRPPHPSCRSSLQAPQEGQRRRGCPLGCGVSLRVWVDPESTAPTTLLTRQALPTDLPAPSAPDLTEPKEEQPPVPSPPTEEEEEEEEEEEAEEEEEEEEDSEVQGEQPKEALLPLAPPQPASPAEEDKMPPYDEQTQAFIDAAQEARNKFEEAERSLKDMEESIRNLEQEISFDFGPNGEFAYLYSQCYELTTNEYVYRLCPFKLVSQKPKLGGSPTSLGTWGSWAGPEHDRFSAMKYEQGTGCWQGPNRSTTVRLLCGKETMVTSTTEPSRCEYLMELMTPAACLEPPPEAPTEDDHDEL
uniref:MRH domain-containing protein n=1 Tax=Papio anubis TaxID=9555 RepID=A0A8I5NHD0_PAPAN